jgi:hypothetical protein
MDAARKARELGEALVRVEGDGRLINREMSRGQMSIMCTDSLMKERR